MSFLSRTVQLKKEREPTWDAVSMSLFLKESLKRHRGFHHSNKEDSARQDSEEALLIFSPQIFNFNNPSLLC